jgi:hypothetical protein
MNGFLIPLFRELRPPELDFGGRRLMYGHHLRRFEEIRTSIPLPPKLHPWKYLCRRDYPGLKALLQAGLKLSEHVITK